MKKLDEALRENVKGLICFDRLTRHIYSVDASIFELLPLGIVIPETKADLVRTVEIAHAFKVPITVRGAATGITGSCLGRGLIIDLSKSLNRIIDVDIQKQEAICQPGVVQNDLNQHLAPFGYRLGPDTSTGNRATIGGMLANNAAGARSLYFGRMVDHVLGTEIILASGEILQFQPISSEEWSVKRNLNHAEGRIYRAIWEIRNNYREEILKQFPQIPRRVSGYNLDELLKDEPLNVSKLIAGSEGTLGIAAEIKVKIAPVIRFSTLVLLFFNDKLNAFNYVPEILEFHPIAFEMIDDQIIQLGRSSPSLREGLHWLEGHDPQSLFIVEFSGQSSAEAEEKAGFFISRMQKDRVGYCRKIVSDKEQINEVWNLRKAGLGILLSKRTYSRAIAFLEDLSVSPYQLFSFMDKFCAYLTGKGKTAGIYGHVGSGCMHIRPYINLQQPEELHLMRQMMMDISSLLLEFNGALSGEHGDGLIRSWLNPKMFGSKLMQAFKELKRAFDPENLMNPGKIVPDSEPFEELRTTPGEILHSPPIFLDFNREGGFELAVDLCNGNGLCRKKEKIMCPSFQATNEEFHSTRARAQALRSIIHGRLPQEDFTSHRMHDVMDLCLSCKGCKTECPSQVDMAKMKAEFLYHYQEKYGYEWRSYFFAHIGDLQKWGSSVAEIINYAAQKLWFKNCLGWFGVAKERTLPLLTHQRFSVWFSGYKQPGGLKKSVVLFNDTFNEFNYPHVGKAAVKILNALGYKVIVPAWSCCGRPAISKGFLLFARKQAENLINRLMVYVKQGLTIIGLEPSCLLTLKDDYFSLMKNPEEQLKTDQLATACLTFDEFLANHIQNGQINLPFNAIPKEVKVHGHCHQKALIGMQPTLNTLRAVPGFQVSEIPSGCCGMAGSFGFEKEHYDISMRIGELCLLPAVRESSQETIIVADGTSCRQQIWDGTQRKAFHLAETLYSKLWFREVQMDFH